MPTPVLDASALLAWLRQEEGGEVVQKVIDDGAAMSTVNVAETLKRQARDGQDPVRLRKQLAGAGLLDGLIEVHDFTSEDATAVARWELICRPHGIGIGDRACLALALRLDTLALTADSVWSEVDVGVQVQNIRHRAIGDRERGDDA